MNIEIFILGIISGILICLLSYTLYFMSNLKHDGFNKSKWDKFSTASDPLLTQKRVCEIVLRDVIITIEEEIHRLKNKDTSIDFAYHMYAKGDISGMSHAKDIVQEAIDRLKIPKEPSKVQCICGGNDHYIAEDDRYHCKCCHGYIPGPRAIIRVARDDSSMSTRT